MSHLLSWGKLELWGAESLGHIQQCLGFAFGSELGEITPGGIWGTIGSTGMEMDLAACKASTVIARICLHALRYTFLLRSSGG